MKPDGAILVDKHHGITSFDVVSALRNMLGVRSAGHCGTLDPIASGLLIVCFGRATKLARFIADGSKRYIADLMLGRTTETYDRYGVVTGESEVPRLSVSEIETVLGSFLGAQVQVVPHHSALKYRGRPMYEYARQHVDIPDKVRDITVHEIKLVEFSHPHVVIDMTCSRGTYVRSLAHDLGEKLGCGAHLCALRRIGIGSHKVEEAFSLIQIAALARLGKMNEFIIDCSDLVEFPSLTVVESREAGIADGIDVVPGDIAAVSGRFKAGDRVSIVDSAGRLLAVGNALMGSREIEANQDGGESVFKYARVI